MNSYEKSKTKTGDKWEKGSINRRHFSASWGISWALKCCDLREISSLEDSRGNFNQKKIRK